MIFRVGMVEASSRSDCYGLLPQDKQFYIATSCESGLCTGRLREPDCFAELFFQGSVLGVFHLGPTTCQVCT